MIPISPVRAALLRADVAHPRPVSPYRLRRADAPPDRWQVVLDTDTDTGADDVDDMSIGGW